MEDAVEDLLASELALGCRVITLALQGGSEFDGSNEEAAGFTDGLEVAVHLDGPRAVAVTEHAAVHLVAQFAHFVAFVVAVQVTGVVVERFNLLGDSEVLVGDGLVAMWA